MLKTWSIAFQGLVQGVGFRPHLLKQSLLLDIPIEIGNSSKGVEVIFNAESEDIAKNTVQQLIEDLPKQAKISGIAITEKSFRVLENSSLVYPEKGVNYLFITPDFSWCNNCKLEFSETNNRRNGFLFISCTQCGPRFSVMTQLPFEREYTSHYSQMCYSCLKEYEDLQNSRAYAQLNACSECFPASHLFLNNELDHTDDQIAHLAKMINQGDVVTVQGIAGYLLLFDFSNAKTIEYVRNVKQRPSKPFALMYADIDLIEKYFFCSKAEKEILESNAAPIVLLKPKENFTSISPLHLISGNSSMVGVMLAPSAYFYKLCLLNRGAIVATSANLSGYPLAYNIETASDLLKEIAAEGWYYERDIQFPQDDSVVQVTPFYQKKLIIRRSRGYAPSLTIDKKYQTDKVILALGADLKSTFTLAYGEQILVSSYQGNLSTFDNQLRFKKNINQLLSLCNVAPDIILIDEHPLFQNKNIINEFLNDQVEVKSVKHHQAHACAILGEFNLFDINDSVLCIVMDGLGYDAPGFIPGAAAYIYTKHTLNIVEHYPLYRYIFNDKMSLLPELSLFSILEGEQLDGREYNIDKHMQHNALRLMHAQPVTNSIGRLCDAMAALLGYSGENTFEGEAAMWLEQYARNGIALFGDEGPFYKLSMVNWSDLIKSCWNDLNNGISRTQIVYSFLHGIAIDMVNLALQSNLKHLAVSGGVFQNVVLVDLLIAHCKKNQINLYLHEALSPNDENISFGQYMFHLHIKSLKKSLCV